MTGETSQTLQHTRPWWIRVRYTPLGDLVRGRITARLDLWGFICGSRLPDPLQQTVYTVARKTRLWRRERLDIARELIEHFQDGLSAGRSAAELHASFGDVEQAARLMRRAKIRARPRIWHVWHRAAQAVGVLFAAVALLYVGLFIRFQFAQPNIAWNYTEEINAEALAVPKDDRAWPLYRKALLALREPAPDGEWADLAEARPGDEAWPELVAYLSEHDEVLASLRAAAAKPRLGFYYGNADDYVSLPENALLDQWTVLPMESDNPMVVAMNLGHLQSLRTLASVLSGDALRAAEAGDGSTTYADMTAQLALVDHARDTAPFLVTDLIAIALFEVALESLGRILSEYTDLLSDEQLTELAHRVCVTFNGGRIEMRLDGERAFHRDLWQRIYSDDGDGDGMLTAQGLRTLVQLDGLQVPGLDELSGMSDEAAIQFLGAASSAAVAPRREMTQLADRLMNDCEIQMRIPPWQQSEWRTDREVQSLALSRFDRWRFMPIVMLFPAIHSAYLAAEKMTQSRDATLVAMALELYRRKHGDWPARLEQLVPDLLPEVPPDRFDGEPLRYRVVDSRPILYSVGSDLNDDDGQLPIEGNKKASRWLGTNWIENPALRATDGDWILWPPVDEPMH